MSRIAARVLGVILVLVGVGMAIPGALLLAAGGSFYYLPAGLAIVVSGVLLLRRDARAISLYGIVFAITVAWSVWEVGFDAWALVARLALLAALGLWLIMPHVRRSVHEGDPPPLFGQRVAQIGAALVVAFVVAAWLANSGYPVQTPSAAGTGTVRNAAGDWAHYGATRAGTRFAPHDAINASNVARLERAWVKRTGVRGTFKGTPIQVGGALYLCTGQNVILSLDPDTGEERWRFDPRIVTPQVGFWDTCRGVTHYALPQAEPGSVCSERIFTATTDARLLAVDARTGARCADFGRNGEISLLPGMGDVKPGFYFVTSPPTIANGALVLGGWVADNQETGEPSGVVRAFDPVHGGLMWAWDLGREDRTGLPPGDESYSRGTPNVWSLTSADEELGLVYVPTGNATPDYYGGHRDAAMEKYASSVVALDARTGRVRWHFQTTHHDIWDYDVPSQPTLVDIPVDGRLRKALVQPTKRAELFLLDRETGEPLARVDEVPVPQTDAAQEWTSPTQPFSAGMPSFARPRLEEADMWGITPVDHALCRLQFQRLRYEGPLTPPSERGTLEYPGIAGGMNWGSVAVDEVNHLMVVNALHMPFIVRLVARDKMTDGMMFGFGGVQKGTPWGVYVMPFFSALFAPCLSPPYGEIGVVDLASRQLLWRRPLGTAAEQGPLGIKARLPLPMGMFYQAGSAVTAGGLIFMGGVIDSTMRALDVFTGEELWTDALPATSEATPMSYVSPATGRQYVLVTVPDGSGRELAGETAAAEERAGTTEEGGYIIAYALPE